MSVLDPAVSVLHAALEATASILPGGLVTAIVLLTFAVRALLLPLALRSFRGQRALSALAPELLRLRASHKNDPQRLAREVQAVHRRAGVNPLAPLLPVLLTAPLFMALYRTVSRLGDPVSAHWLPLLSTGPGLAWLLFALLVTALVVVAVISSRQQPAEAPRLLRLMPYGTVAMAVVVPVAVSVYLLSTTTWTVIERAVLPRLA